MCLSLLYTSVLLKLTSCVVKTHFNAHLSLQYNLCGVPAPASSRKRISKKLTYSHTNTSLLSYFIVDDVIVALFTSYGVYFLRCLLSTIIFCRFHVIGVVHTLHLPYLTLYCTLPHILPFVTLHLTLPYLVPYILHYLTLPYVLPSVTLPYLLPYVLRYLTSYLMFCLTLPKITLHLTLALSLPYVLPYLTWYLTLPYIIPYLNLHFALPYHTLPFTLLYLRCV